jgi:hypothetical protein
MIVDEGSAQWYPVYRHLIVVAQVFFRVIALTLLVGQAGFTFAFGLGP